MKHAWILPVCISAMVLPPVAATAQMALATTWEFPIHGPVAIASQRNGVTVYRGMGETIVEYPNGAISAWTDGDVPQKHVGWPASVEDHDRMARAYFMRHGVPEREIDQTLHFSGFSSGAELGNPNEVHTERLGFSTTLNRRVEGFKVLDSHAGIQLNADGKPVALALSWPPVPPETIKEAQNLRATLERGWKPPETVIHGLRVLGTEVVLRYRAFSSEPSWKAVIRVEGLSGPTMHTFIDLDEQGHRVDTVDRSGSKPEFEKVQPAGPSR